MAVLAILKWRAEQGIWTFGPDLCESGLSSTQRQQRDLWWNAQPHREADCAQPPVHVERGLLREYGTVSIRHGQVIQPGDEGRDQPRRIDVMIHDLDLHLTAVRVSGEAQLNPELGRAAKRIRIVRKQNIRNVAPHQRLDVLEHWAGW